jgi:putative endonuclease
MNNWVVYLVQCSDKSLYCGISNDVQRRLKEHNSGKGAKYTRARRPVELIEVSPEMTKPEALKLEYRIKKMPADQKLCELIRRQHDHLFKLFKRDCQGLRHDIREIVKIIDKLLKEI